MAGPRAGVFATGKQIATDLTAAPSFPVVALNTLLGDCVLPTKTCLPRTHQCARRAGSSVTHQWTRVWACVPSLRAGLGTAMRRNSGDRLWVDLLCAPTVIRARILGKRRVAARASPARGLIWVLVLILLLHLVGMPFLDAVKMGNRPARRARPDSRRPHYLISADDALVLSVLNILPDPSW